ncbi:MAG: cell envelope integrity protein TolA [Dissulfurispiraceae bacterium]
MRSPTLYGPVTFSLILHLSGIVVAFLIIKHSNIYESAKPYIVSLADNIEASAPSGASQAPAKELASHKTDKTTSPLIAAKQKVQEDKKLENDKLMNERIEALKAKKKIEKMATLRKLVDVNTSRNSASKDLSPPKGKSTLSGTGGNASGGGDYYSLVVSKIRQQWIYPESIDKDLEAIVSIRIAVDGHVTVDKIEKSSNNLLFDRSVLRAIAMSSPLPPPRQEMEVGVRFRP